MNTAKPVVVENKRITRPPDRVSGYRVSVVATPPTEFFRVYVDSPEEGVLVCRTLWAFFQLWEGHFKDKHARLDRLDLEVPDEEHDWVTWRDADGRDIQTILRQDAE